MKTFILAAMAASLSISTAGAAQIMWRSPTAGVLEVTAAPPSTPTDGDPAVPLSPAGNFGIFYGSTPARPNTSLFIQPLARTGFPGAGYTYAVFGGLPAGVAVNPSTGMITGKIAATGTYSLSITIRRDGAADTVTATIIVG
ncbi:putative Ig domain-containing protein [Rhizobium leguminosarum]